MSLMNKKDKHHQPQRGGRCYSRVQILGFSSRSNVESRRGRTRESLTPLRGSSSSRHCIPGAHSPGYHRSSIPAWMRRRVRDAGSTLTLTRLHARGRFRLRWSATPVRDFHVVPPSQQDSELTFCGFQWSAGTDSRGAGCEKGFSDQPPVITFSASEKGCKSIL